MIETKTHPTEVELAAFLDRTLPQKEKDHLEEHIAACEECLDRIVSAHESVEEFRKAVLPKRRKDNIMKKINLYLIFAVISFMLSFVMHEYFIQFLVAALLLGTKWIVDAKSTRMLVMIYEAWKKGGEKEASRMLEILNSKPKNRL